MRSGEHRGAGRDEHGAEHDRPQDPPEQQPVLVRRRHRERREDQGEHEHVVDRQRELDQVAGQVLAARLAAARRRHEHAEAEGQPDPDGAPGRRLPERNELRVPVQDEEVEGEHAADDQGQDQPENSIQGHGTTSGSGCAEGLSRPWPSTVGRGGPPRGGRDDAADRLGYSPSAPSIADGRFPVKTRRGYPGGV
jgi:hypothetical protein